MAPEFAAVFIALFVGHTIGDHWVQTGHQAACKGARTNAGRVACAGHVLSLTATKLVLLAGAWLVLDLELSIGAVALAFVIDAVSHYWADRRFTLEWLADKVGKTGFYHQGTDLVDVNGKAVPHIGTGKYALDQSFHHFWLFVAALIAIS